MKYWIVVFCYIFTSAAYAGKNLFCSEVFDPQRFLADEIYFDPLTNFKKVNPEEVESWEYLKEWAIDSELRIYLRTQTAYKYGLPAKGENFERIIAEFKKYKAEKPSFFSFSFYHAKQWPRRGKLIKEYFVQYGIDLKKNPLRFIWAPHDPATFADQTLLHKLYDWPSHYLTHPLAEVTKSYRQLSIFGNLIVFSGIMGGVSYYQLKNYQERIGKLRELILNDPRFKAISEQLSAGYITFAEGVEQASELEKELQQIDSVESLAQSKIWEPMKKLKDKGFFKTEEQYEEFLSEYYSFYQGHINLEGLKSKINERVLGLGYTVKEFSILTGFGTYLPSDTQVHIADATKEEDKLIEYYVDLGLQDSTEMHRVALLNKFRKEKSPKLVRVGYLADEFKLKSNDRDSLMNATKKLLLESSVDDWNENLHELDALVTDLKLPPQATFYLMDSFLPEQQLENEIELDRKNEIKTTSKSKLLAYTLARPHLSAHYNFYEHQGEVVRLTGLMGNIQMGQKLREIFAESFPKDKAVLYQRLEEEGMFPEVTQSTELPIELKQILLQKQVAYELFIEQRLYKNEDPIQNYQEAAEINKRFLASIEL
ncbi:MAG: hypothetical protein VYA54_02960 [Bdellovibrionota bacterium]|nr:hypothetical protein [Bdellovibrionota bacterium]